DVSDTEYHLVSRHGLDHGPAVLLRDCHGPAEYQRGEERVTMQQKPVAESTSGGTYFSRRMWYPLSANATAGPTCIWSWVQMRTASAKRGSAAACFQSVNT